MPTDAMPRNGNAESPRCGLTSAIAGWPPRSGTVWWSTTITSMPAARARTIASRSLVPQSPGTMRPRRDQLAGRRRAEAVALVAPGHPRDHLGAAVAQEAGEQRAGGDAVDVVVAEHRDALAAQHRAGQAIGGGREAGHRGLALGPAQ